MFNIDLIYIIINVCLLLVFLFQGRQIGQGGNYKLCAFWCIITYTLVLGLRYDRGYDYLHYVDFYVHGYEEGSQIVYVFINELLKEVGVGRYYIFVVYSFIEILCAFFFLKRYREYGNYIIPFFMISTLVFNEYLVRQALGFSFVYLCLDSLFELTQRKHYDSKRVLLLFKIVICFFVAYSIHSACGYMLIAMIVLHFLYQKPIPIKISIPSLIFATYFFSRWFDFTWLNPILETVAGEDERMSAYVNNSDNWFSIDAVDTERFARNEVVLFVEILGTISLYSLGKKAIEKCFNKREAYSLYNYFVIGTIALNGVRTLELLQRMANNFAMFWFFPLSIVLYHKKQIIKSPMEHVALLLQIWWMYNYLKYLFFPGDMTKFLWDM